MGGRGSSSGGGGGQSLTPEKREQIAKNVATHSPSQNDKAIKNIERAIEREEKIVKNFKQYKQIGYVKSKTDDWWVGHEESYNSLRAQLEEYKKQRKIQKK